MLTKKLSNKRKHVDNSIKKINTIKLDKNKEIKKLEELKIDDTLFKINDNVEVKCLGQKVCSIGKILLIEKIDGGTIVKVQWY